MWAEESEGGRGRGIAAAIEGFFAASWFGWGQSDAPGWLVPILIVGSVLGWMFLIVGVIMAVRSPAGSTPMAAPTVRRGYWVVVSIELAVCFAGSTLVAYVFGPEYVAGWIALVVAVHFAPLGRLFGEALLVWLAVATALVAVASLVVAATTSEASATIAGPGMGLGLLFAAAATVVGLRIPARA